MVLIQYWKKLYLTQKTLLSQAHTLIVFLKLLWNNFNLNEFQNKIEIIKKRYENEGYSLARINGPDRIIENGIITLNVSKV